MKSFWWALSHRKAKNFIQHRLESYDFVIFFEDKLIYLNQILSVEHFSMRAKNLPPQVVCISVNIESNILQKAWKKVLQFLDTSLEKQKPPCRFEQDGSQCGTMYYLFFTFVKPWPLLLLLRPWLFTFVNPWLLLSPWFSLFLTLSAVIQPHVFQIFMSLATILPWFSTISCPWLSSCPGLAFSS